MTSESAYTREQATALQDAFKLCRRLVRSVRHSGAGKILNGHMNRLCDMIADVEGLGPNSAPLVRAVLGAVRGFMAEIRPGETVNDLHVAWAVADDALGHALLALSGLDFALTRYHAQATTARVADALARLPE